MNEMTTESNNHLFAGLDALYYQSGEWLSDIAFWHDEVMFLQKLIKENMSGALPGPINEGFRKATAELETIAQHALPDLLKTAEEHKHNMALLMEDRLHDREIYRRKKHKDLMQNVLQFNTHFRNLKMKIFELVEEVAIVNLNTGAHYWKGYTNSERHKTVAEVSNIISRHGNILSSNIFSDIEISFIIESEGKKVAELYNELSKNIDLDEKTLDVINVYKDCKIYLNITFTDARGNTRVDPGGMMY